MMLLIFGWMCLGSAWIIYGCAKDILRHRGHISPFNAALMFAVALEFHAVGMTGQTGVRLLDIWGGLTFPTLYPGSYAVASMLVLIGKSIFVWLVALRQGREYHKTFWWSYVLAMVGWVPISMALTRGWQFLA